MPVFDENDFSLLREPKQYGNPTGRPDPSVDIPAGNAPKERSVMDIVNASLLGGAVGMASARDPMAGFKVMEAMKNRELQEKQLEQEEERNAYRDIDNIFKVTANFEDKEAAAKFVRAAVKASPALDKRFGGLIGDESFKLKVGDKNEIVIETEVKENEVKMPSGKVLPPGTYKLTYDANSFQQGKNPVPRKIETGKPQEGATGELGKIDQKDYTPESMKEYLKTKDRSVLVPKDDKGPSVGNDREALALELGAKNFAALSPEQKKEVNAEVKRREDERLEVSEKREGRLAGQFAQNMSIQERRAAQTDERIRLQEEQQKRLLPSQQKTLTGNRTAKAAIDDYAQGYEEFIQESKGSTLSDIFRGAIAKNKNAQRAADLVTAEGRTPAEIKLAAKYNALVGNIRSLTDEVGVLTDVDAVRILGSFDPSLDRKQVRANLAARRKTHERAENAALEDYQAMGKDVSGFLNRRATDSPGGARPQQSEIEAAKKRLGIK